MTKTKSRYTIPPKTFTPRFDFADRFYLDEEILRLLKINEPLGGYKNIIPAIKYCREVTAMGLKESKDYVEKIRDADAAKYRVQALGL